MLTENYNELLRILQENSSLNDISFIPTYKKDNIMRPITSPICSVGTKKTEIITNIYSFQNFELTLYSPLSLGGRGCYEYAYRIGEFLLSNAVGIVKVTVGSVDYDVNNIAFYVSIEINCRSDLFRTDESEQSPIGVEINSTSFNAKYCKIYEKKDCYPVYEMWERNPLEILQGDKSYVIELGNFDASLMDSFSLLSDFSLRFGTDVYTGCKFGDVNYDVVYGIVELAKIYAKDKTVIVS